MISWVVSFKDYTGFRTLPKLAWFLLFLFKANVIYFFTFFLEFCFIIFYDLSSMGLVLGSEPDSPILES